LIAFWSSNIKGPIVARQWIGIYSVSASLDS
jgi:hypothetical protein